LGRMYLLLPSTTCPASCYQLTPDRERSAAERAIWKSGVFPRKLHSGNIRRRPTLPGCFVY